MEYLERRLRTPRVAGACKRPRGRLENRFRNVVLIAAVQILDVQIEPAFLHERLQELLDQFRLQIANRASL